MLPLCLLVILLAVCWLKPRWLPRGIVWLLCHTVYRVRVFGRQHIPATGPALLVCNHVTYLDWLFLLAAQKRHIHFVIFAGWTRVWGLGRLLKWAGVIPIDRSAGPRAIVQALREAGEVLQQGGVVCIFAEGRFTRTGFLLPFQRGFEQISKHCPGAPVIPVYLEQAWGSIFSFWGGTLIWKRPRRLPYPITVAFGAALPVRTSAFEVRCAMQKLAADCAIDRSATLLPMHRQFVRTARRWRQMSRPCLIDEANSVRPMLRYCQALVEAICLARALRPLLENETLIGVRGAAGTHVALANIALALLGKVAVNLDPDPGGRVRPTGLRQVLFDPLSAAPELGYKDEPCAGVKAIDIADLLTRITPWQRFRVRLGVWLLPRLVLERWLLRLGRHRARDAAAIVFEPTAGASQPVLLRHRHLAANADALAEVVHVAAQDRLLASAPFSQGFGYLLALWAPLRFGAAIVYHPRSDAPDDARRAGALCRQHGCTLFLANPAILNACLAACAPDDFRSLRWLWSGGAPLSAGVAQALEQKFGIAPLEGFGCSAVTAAATVNVPDQDLAGFRQLGRRAGTIGQPLPGVAARIVDAKTGAALPAGEAGLLQFFGPNMAPILPGGLGAAAITTDGASHSGDGWYDTGLIGSVDEAGFITLTPGARIADQSELGRAAA